MSWREVFMVETISSTMWALQNFWPPKLSALSSCHFSTLKPCRRPSHCLPSLTQQPTWAGSSSMIRLTWTLFARLPYSKLPRFYYSLWIQGKEVKMNFDHGTTTLGFKYQVGKFNRELRELRKTYSREESCLLWTPEPLAGCTSGLAVWRRSSRSTSSCSAPWLEVLQTVLTGRGFCPSRWDFLSIFQWENTLESCFQPVTCSVDCTSCGIERGSVLLLPASCSPTWLTITR